MIGSDNPKVSVIITTYYRNETLERAIQGILEQTYQPIELIVVDDSGEAHAKQLVEKYDSIIYIPHDLNKGHIEAWHTGFNHATGKYIQLHDDDDWLAPKKIEKQAKLLSDHETGVVHCGIDYINRKERIPNNHLAGDVLKEALDQKVFLAQTTTMLISSTTLNSVFPLNDYGAADDVHLIIELAKRAQFDYVPEPLVYREIRQDSKGSTIDAWIARLKILAEYEELYNQVGKVFKHDQLSHIHYKVALKHRSNGVLTESLKSHLKSIYYSPKSEPKLVFSMVASLFISPKNKLSNFL